MQDLVGNELRPGSFVINTYSNCGAPMIRFGIMCSANQAWCWGSVRRFGWTEKPIKVKSDKFMKIHSTQIPLDIRIVLMTKFIEHKSKALRTNFGASLDK